MYIAKIIDEFKVVVNAGEQQGICAGDILVVYETDCLITDPDTGEELGILDITKAYLRVLHNYEKMSICVNAKIEDGKDIFGHFINNPRYMPLQYAPDEVIEKRRLNLIRIKDKVRPANPEEAKLLCLTN